MSNLKKNYLGIVYAYDAFSEEERKEINEIASKIVPVKDAYLMHLSAEQMAGILVIALGLATSSIAIGFFEALGSDIYNSLKDKISKILSKKDKPTIKFTMKYNDTLINISSSSNDENEIKIVFDTIDKAKDLAINVLNNNKTPKMTEINIIYNNGWFINYGQNWNPPEKIAYFEYDIHNNEWKLTGPYYMDNGNIYHIQDDKIKRIGKIDEN